MTGMDLTLLQDFIRGTHIRKTYAFLRGSDFWDEDQLCSYRTEKLKKLVTHCYHNVPYYHKLFDSINLKPENIITLDDLRKIPTLSKQTVRDNSLDFIPKNINNKSRLIRTAKTGGTTGMPLVFYKNVYTRDFTWGSYHRWYDWMNVSSSDRIAVLWGARTVLSEKKSIRDFVLKKFSNNLTINSFNLNDETLPNVTKQLIDYKPVLLRGYLSAIFQVAQYFRKNNLSIPSLKAISSTTETLLPIYRNYIEETFGVKMFDQYGCGECNGIAYECDAHNGLHITEEHCIVEVLDENDKPCFDKVGRIVITDLDNEAFPFIRYENGDSAIMSSSKCKCGRSSHILKELSGRTKDTIILKDGSEVHGVFFTDIFHELGYDNFEYFTRFQIYQNKPGDYECRLESTSKTLDEVKINNIKEVLSRYGNNVKIVIKPKLENDISGKFRYIISDLS